MTTYPEREASTSTAANLSNFVPWRGWNKVDAQISQVAVAAAFDSDMAETTVQRTHSAQTGASNSSRKFNLDERDTRDIIVYKMRTGYEITSQKELCKELDRDPNWRCSRKPIARGTSRLNVQTRDLYNEPQRSAYSKYPNSTSSIASVGLPRKVYWRRLLFGHFQNLYIVSPDSSPGTSPSDSFNNSPDHGPSRSNTV